MTDERDLPDGVINADPAGGWDEVDDEESAERKAAAQSQTAPDGDIESAEPTQVADPDLSSDVQDEDAGDR